MITKSFLSLLALLYDGENILPRGAGGRLIGNDGVGLVVEREPQKQAKRRNKSDTNSQKRFPSLLLLKSVGCGIINIYGTYSRTFYVDKLKNFSCRFFSQAEF